MILLMVQKSQGQPPKGCIKPVNNGINHQPQLAAGFQPSTVVFVTISKSQDSTFILLEKSSMHPLCYKVFLDKGVFTKGFKALFPGRWFHDMLGPPSCTQHLKWAGMIIQGSLEDLLVVVW